MGNKLARTTQVSASEYYLHDLPSSYNLVLKEALGGGRLLKSVQCVHDEGLLLVKVYFKRGESLDLKVLSLSTWMGTLACRLTHRNAKPSKAFVNWRMSSYYDFCGYVSWRCIIVRCFTISRRLGLSRSTRRSYMKFEISSRTSSTRMYGLFR